MSRIITLIGILAVGHQFSIFNFQFSISSVLAEEIEVPAFSGRPYDEHPILAPCTRYDDRYDTLGFNSNYLQDWKTIYHTRVNAVVQEYLETPQVQCEAATYPELLEPGSQLSSLARSLPIWSDGTVPLSRLDTSRVLLEYLRLYECGLMEFRKKSLFETAKEVALKLRNPVFLRFDEISPEELQNANTIREERIVARKTLNRVLTLTGTMDRLRPLDTELECMQRFSLDVRNIAALSAEASACLPRTWNAADALRDAPSTPSTLFSQ